MKIPKSVRIGGVEYPVNFAPNINNGTSLCYGQIDYDESKIELSSTHGRSHDMQCITLLHEILHGIRYHAGVTIDNEEEIVDMYSKGLYQVLQDNAHRLFNIERAAARKVRQ